MRHNVIETLVGGVVLALAAAFAWFAVSVANLQRSGGYELMARFDRIDGLSQGADIRMSGIKVGTVGGVSLDPKTYFAQVRLRIDGDLKVPNDTVAEVASEGLLGGRYLNLLPGASDDVLAPGGTIRFTQAPVDLIQMLGKFMFTAADDKSKQQAKPAP